MKLYYKQLIYKHMFFFAHSKEVRSLAGSSSKFQSRAIINVCGVTSNFYKKYGKNQKWTGKQLLNFHV